MSDRADLVRSQWAAPGERERRSARIRASLAAADKRAANAKRSAYAQSPEGQANASRAGRKGQRWCLPAMDQATRRTYDKLRREVGATEALRTLRLVKVLSRLT